MVGGQRTQSIELGRQVDYQVRVTKFNRPRVPRHKTSEENRQHCGTYCINMSCNSYCKALHVERFLGEFVRKPWYTCRIVHD